MANQDFGIEFLNVELKFDLELMAEDGEILSDEDLILWMGQASRNFMKFGFGYNDRSNSFTVSVTDRGHIVGNEKPPCMTQHGKSHMSALQKCYFLIEVCGLGKMKEAAMTEGLARREDLLNEQLAGLLKKKR